MTAVKAQFVPGMPPWRYCMDMVCADEHTLYAIDAMNNGPYGYCYRIRLPNAPTSMAGATAEVVATGLFNPTGLAYATNTGALAVSEAGATAYTDPSGNYNYKNILGGANIRYLIGSGVLPVTRVNNDQSGYRSDSVQGPRGICLSPNGDWMYGLEAQLFVITNYIQKAMWAWGPNGKESIMVGGFSVGNFSFWGPFDNVGTIKCSRDGNFVFYPYGCWYFKSSTRGINGFGSNPDGWSQYNAQRGWFNLGGLKTGGDLPWKINDPGDKFPAVAAISGATKYDVVSRCGLPDPRNPNWGQNYGVFPWRSGTGVFPSASRVCVAPSGAAYAINCDASSGSGDGYGSDGISFGAPGGTLYQVYGKYDPPAGDTHIPLDLSLAATYTGNSYTSPPGAKFWKGYDSISSPVLTEDYPPKPEAH